MTMVRTEVQYSSSESIFPKDSKYGFGLSLSHQGETGDAKTRSRKSPLNGSSLSTRYVQKEGKSQQSPGCLHTGRALAGACVGVDGTPTRVGEAEGGEIILHGSFMSTLPCARSDIDMKIHICELNKVKLTAILLGTPCILIDNLREHIVSLCGRHIITDTLNYYLLST